VDVVRYHFSTQHIARIVALTMICFAVYLYPRLRRGFGTFCLILVISGIGLAIYCQSQPLLPGNRPRSRHRSYLRWFDCLSDSNTLHYRHHAFASRLPCRISFLWFNPIFFTPLILFIAGLVLIFVGCILRYWFFSTATTEFACFALPPQDNIQSTNHFPSALEEPPSLVAAAARPPLPTPAGRKPRNAPTHFEKTLKASLRLRSRP